MLIRSQDKADLINIDNISVMTASTTAINEDRYVIGIGNPSESLHTYTIGRYSTYDKAIKVLDMIVDWYRYINCPIVNGTRIPDPVFQMPQDDEVEP